MGLVKVGGWQHAAGWEEPQDNQLAQQVARNFKHIAVLVDLTKGNFCYYYQMNYCFRIDLDLLAVR